MTRRDRRRDLPTPAPPRHFMAPTQCSQQSVRRALEDGESERTLLSWLGPLPEWEVQMERCFGRRWRGRHLRRIRQLDGAEDVYHALLDAIENQRSQSDP